MSVRITSVTPSKFNKGTKPCTITYKVKSIDAGAGNISFELSGSDKIWFVENGVRTKKLRSESINITSDYVNFRKETNIDVTVTPSSTQMAFIKATAVDKIGNKSSNNINITYE